MTERDDTGVRPSAPDVGGGGRRVRMAPVAAALLVAACGAAAAELQEPVPLPERSPIEYPVALWDEKIQGETELMIHVNEHGNVDSVLVSKPSGWAAFDSAALAGARQLRFTPGRKGDRRIAMWTKMPVRFTQDSTATVGAVRASGVQP
jgi:TonB family protein